MGITLVTGLFDIGRGDIAGKFKRPFSYYLKHIKLLLESCKDINMVIYIERKHFKYIKYFRLSSLNTVIVNRELDYFRGLSFYERIQKIRTCNDWLSQNKWLRETPQAKLDLYNPVIMSKISMLKEAINYFDSTHYFWLDAGITKIVEPNLLRVVPNIEKIVESFLFICYPFNSTGEVHGFSKSDMSKYCKGNNIDRIAIGGLFGGRKDSIYKISENYYEVLDKTLMNGHMGTEESVFTILTYLNPEIQIEFIRKNRLVSEFLKIIKY